MPNRVENCENENPETPEPKVEKTGTHNADTVTTFFTDHILPKINSPEYWKEKVLEKRNESECKPQLEIIDLVVQLNAISDDFEGDFHSTEAFDSMYDEILVIQNGQNWTSSSWKLIVIPMLIPPLGGGRVFISGIFHSRANIDIFSNWSKISNKNADFKILPEPFVHSDVQRNISLDENGPPYTQARPADWLNHSVNDISLESAKNYSFEFNDLENSHERVPVPNMVPVPSPVPTRPPLPVPGPSNVPSPVKTEDEETFYGFKMTRPREQHISVVDAMELFHSIVEINSKDEHLKPYNSKESTPKVHQNKRNNFKIEKRSKNEPIDRKMSRYIPMKFFAEFISSFLKK